MVISRGLMGASVTIREVERLFCLSSDSEKRRESPVSFRTRWALRSKIFGVDVSGRSRNIMIKARIDAQKVSQSDQRQDFAVTEKPARRGPSEGLWTTFVFQSAKVKKKQWFCKHNIPSTYSSDPSHHGKWEVEDAVYISEQGTA